MALECRLLWHRPPLDGSCWSLFAGRVGIFVSGLVSGGTLGGVGRYLKEKNPACLVVAVEPKNVSALLGHEPGLHKIQGIGDGFVPAVLDRSLIDEVVEVTDEDAIGTARNLARHAGALVGTSSGANVWAAREMAAKQTVLICYSCSYSLSFWRNMCNISRFIFRFRMCH